MGPKWVYSKGVPEGYLQLGRHTTMNVHQVGAEVGVPIMIYGKQGLNWLLLRCAGTNRED